MEQPITRERFWSLNFYRCIFMNEKTDKVLWAICIIFRVLDPDHWRCAGFDQILRWIANHRSDHQGLVCHSRRCALCLMVFYLRACATQRPPTTTTHVPSRSQQPDAMLARASYFKCHVATCNRSIRLYATAAAVWLRNKTALCRVIYYKVNQGRL